MLAVIRKYRRAFLALLVSGLLAGILVSNYKDQYRTGNINYNSVLKNFSVTKSILLSKPIKKIQFFKLPDDVTRKIFTDSRIKDSEHTEPKQNKSEIEQNYHKRDANVTKTVYPVTLYAPYLIENRKLCTSVANLSVLVIVHTAPNNFVRRMSMRATWTNETYFKHLGITRVLFLLGTVKNITLQKNIETEFQTFGDLLQGDFVDSYRNLTHKGVMAYKWISEHCRNAKIILKVDDDVVVNMFVLLTEYLPTYENKTKQILCNHILPGTMPILREKKSKWFVDENEFKGKKFYPRYCSGFMVMFTNDFMPALYKGASLTPFFWVDDVYLYGLVPAQVPGIKYNGLKPKTVQLTGQLALKCYENATRTCDYLVTGAGSRSVMEKIWMHMRNAYETMMMPTTTEIDIYTYSSPANITNPSHLSRKQIPK